MSVLTGKEIESLLKKGGEGGLHITPLVKPFDPEKSNTVDLRLGLDFITMKKGSLSALTFDPERKEELAENLAKFYDRAYVGLWRPFILHPGELVLGATFEYLRLPNDLFAEVTARSSWGRLGLIIATATAVHPGFKGCLTLELANHGNIPIELYPITPIAQIVFHKLDHEQPPYSGVYSGFAGPTGPDWSRLHEKDGDFWGWIPERVNRFETTARRI